MLQRAAVQRAAVDTNECAALCPQWSCICTQKSLIEVLPCLSCFINDHLALQAAVMPQI
jgi:hypothetical protein